VRELGGRTAICFNPLSVGARSYTPPPIFQLGVLKLEKAIFDNLSFGVLLLEIIGKLSEAVVAQILQQILNVPVFPRFPAR